jgi:exopolysaccharide biosynthesis polyprenyl glycosylphosphotransferase
VPRRERDYVLRRALAASDLVAIVAALLIAFSISPVENRDLGQAVWVLPVLPIWLALFRIYGLYGLDAKRINHGVLDELPALFHAFLIGLLVTWVWFRIAPVHKLGLGEALTLGLAAFFLVVFMRATVRRLALGWFGCERVLFVGAAPVLQPLLRKIRTHPEYALDPVGVVVGGSANVHTDLPVLGTLETVDLQDAISRHEVERVIVVQADVDDETILELLQGSGAKVSILPQQVDAMGPSVQVDNIEGVTVFGLNPLALSRSSRFLKRSMDVVGAGLGLLLLAPLMAAAAIAIKLDSRGPVLFRQQRIGKEGRRFMLTKFRTMATDAEQRLDELLRFSEDRYWLKVDHDPRITRVGRFLRLTSLDELPQLWNVLRGDMSLVGPRPLIASEDEQIRGYARLRLQLAPGITGLWQVLGRTTIPFEEMVKLDYLYVANWSLWTDVNLLLRTIPAVLFRRGAN